MRRNKKRRIIDRPLYRVIEQKIYDQMDNMIDEWVRAIMYRSHVDNNGANIFMFIK